MVDLYREVAVPPLPTPELRLSPAGVLAKRDLCREPGWPSPHWTVLDMPAGDRSHWVGQHLVDQAVAGWSVLVRREVRGA
jgi:hypothetical protein